LVKLAAMLILMLAAVFQVFDGFGDMNQWLRQTPEALALTARDSAHGDTTRALLLVFFTGAVAMPHLFHMLFAENTDSNDLRAATWGLPLYLLLLSLPVLPVAWASIKLGQALPPDYSGLDIGLALQSPGVSAAAFFATLSAASAAIIVTTLALANMCLNHLVLPSRVMRIGEEDDIYGRLMWLRRSLVTVLILAGYTFYVLLGGSHSLSQLCLVALAGILQFLPGILAVPYWPNANRKGLQAGLWGGMGIWFFSLLLPATSSYQPHLHQAYIYLFGPEVNLWTAATMLSLGLNISLFVVVSLITRTSDDERVAAEICSMDDLTRPTRQVLSVSNAAEFADQLALALGPRTAQSEVQRALAELRFSPGESRPYALRRLRTRLEANLSGLLGPAVAHNIIEQCLPFQPGSNEDLQLIERNLDSASFRFSGLAADLDNLRRHYRETLDNLPIGVCSIGADGEMLMWNRGMESITGIASSDVLGSLLLALPAPWRDIIEQFQQGSDDTLLKTEVESGDGNTRWISLHRTSADQRSGDTVILVEDITDLERLEEELLHNERLASIGRLAAGVAHEIGNPVTGIACLAQNLEYASEPGEIKATALDILKQTERVGRIVESLVNFSHAGSSAGDARLVPCNLADCIDEAIHLLSLDREARQVRFSNYCDRELVVLADSQRLLQVFVNLLGNGRDACDHNGHVQVCAHNDSERVLIDIDDNGCGIPQELHSQVFEPFFTTKDPGVGTGLGLALVFSIMEDMGGSVHITSPLQPGQALPGTRITLELALASYDATFTL
jgi:PAS domain S-box-containing protein